MSSARIQHTAFPSTQVPPNVASVLVPSQARLTEAIVSASSAEVSEYAGRSSGRAGRRLGRAVAGGRCGRRLGRAVAEARRGFVALIERSEEDPHAPSRAFFDGLGCTPEN